MSQKPTFARLGVVSEGTLRDEDLISAFAGELDYYTKRLRLSRDRRKRFADTLQWYRDHEGADPMALMECLEEIAPPYCYFGTAEGDGACFGFWPDINSAKEECNVFDAGTSIPRECWPSDVLFVNDHGNVTCGHVDRRGRFKAYWDCV